jgi:ABC-type glycerol-3-phosphate transport system permease component
MERGVLDAEPDGGRCGPADGLHRQLFQPRGSVLRETQSAASTMAIAPILILGWFSQKQLVRGLTFGAVK